MLAIRSGLAHASGVALPGNGKKERPGRQVAVDGQGPGVYLGGTRGLFHSTQYSVQQYLPTTTLLRSFRFKVGALGLYLDSLVLYPGSARISTLEPFVHLTGPRDKLPAVWLRKVDVEPLHPTLPPANGIPYTSTLLLARPGSHHTSPHRTVSHGTARLEPWPRENLVSYISKTSQVHGPRTHAADERPWDTLPRSK